MAQNPELAAKIGKDNINHICGAGGGFGPVRIYIYLEISNTYICFLPNLIIIACLHLLYF
jgi:hypothetical protein